jgi:hypothetical protein
MASHVTRELLQLYKLLTLSIWLGCAAVQSVRSAPLEELCTAHFEPNPKTLTGPKIVTSDGSQLFLLDDPERAFTIHKVAKKAKPVGIFLTKKALLPIVLDLDPWDPTLGIPGSAWQAIFGEANQFMTTVPPGVYQAEMRYASRSPRSSAGVCVAISEPFVLKDGFVILTTD